jgi:phospholipid-translocating ATPase
MLLSMVLFENSFTNIVGIAFSALILCELFNVAAEIHRWQPLMVAAELLSLAFYVAAVFLLPFTFDLAFVLTWAFLAKTLLLVAAAVLPCFAVEWLHKKLHPPSYAKVQRE